MKNRSVLAILGLVCSVLGGASAHAQASRTWVSGVGDDANPCSRTAPCKTYAGAISKTAPSGEINTLDPGGFGAVTITKSISIDGNPGVIAGVLVSGTNGIVVSCACTVQLRNLDIDGVGSGLSGITVLAGSGVQNVLVENTRIYGFTADGITFAPGTAGSTLVVKNTILNDNAGNGVLVAPAGVSATAELKDVSAVRNKTGVRVQDNGSATIDHGLFSHNSKAGVSAASTSAAASVNVSNSVSSYNAQGINVSGALATAVAANMNIFGNTGFGWSIGGGTIISFGNNQVGGNGTNGAPSSTALQQ